MGYLYISHIEEMLKLIECIIPEHMQSVMIPAEWMMLVLSVCFHDMGMLITKDEFGNRDTSAFSDYKKSVYDLDYGRDYYLKASKLGRSFFCFYGLFKICETRIICPLKVDRQNIKTVTVRSISHGTTFKILF